MNPRVFHYVLLICLTATSLTNSGCVTGCKPDTEPKLVVSFLNPKDYTSVYGLQNTVNNIPAFLPTIWEIPISIVADKTTVIFSSSTTQDTLTLVYKRETKLQSTACGFRLFFSNIAVAQPTTFTDYSFEPELNADGKLNLFINE